MEAGWAKPFLASTNFKTFKKNTFELSKLKEKQKSRKVLKKLFSSDIVKKMGTHQIC